MTTPYPPIYDVFARIEESFSKTELGPSRWYIAAIAALTAGSEPELCGDLYTYLLTKPEFSSPIQRHALIRRLREALVKSVIIIGVCKPLEAIMAINKCERDEDKDLSATRQGWQCDEANRQRGVDSIAKRYTKDTSSTLALFDDHKDFRWITEQITYGLFISDNQVLDDLEAEMVVLPGIMMQNLKTESHWHVRALRRLGVSVHDAKCVWDSVQMVAEYFGLKLDRVPTVDEVENDV